MFFAETRHSYKKKERKKENLGMHNQKSVEQEVGDMSL